MIRSATTAAPSLPEFEFIGIDAPLTDEAIEALAALLIELAESNPKE